MTRLHSMVPFRMALYGLVLFTAVASALSQEYCSTENTGADNNAVQNIYQSNGACYDQCKSSYAFAVVQYKSCWCSNFIPASQQPVGSCNQKCPGFPNDRCGNVAEGLYGYIALPGQPSGTAGTAANTQPSSTATSYPTQPVSTASSSSPTSDPAAATSSDPTTAIVSVTTSTTAVVSSVVTPTSIATVTAVSTTTTSVGSVENTSLTSLQSSTSTQQLATSETQAPTSYVSQTVFQTVTQSQSPSTVVSYVTPTPTSSAGASSTTTSLSSSSSLTIAPAIVPILQTTEISNILTTATVTPTPVTSVRVVTVSGDAVTQTVTSTPSIAAASDPNNLKLQRKGLSGGAIAGAVIGCLLGVAALILGACLLWRRKKRQPDAEVAGRGGIRSPRRNTSVLSRTGLLSRNRPVSMVEHNIAEEPPYHNTGTGNNSVRHSMLFGAGAGAGEGVSPVSPLGSSHDNDSNRRHSRPLVYDQRLNPSALFANAEGNGSRISIQDQQDYSRPLGIMNPDPRLSTDTRA